MIIEITGIVQGVGFRPTVARVARDIGIGGYVRNKGSHVEIYLHTSDPTVAERFMEKLKENLPRTAAIYSVRIIPGMHEGDYTAFSIVRSEDSARFSTIPPDTAICDDCLRELFEPGNRRYHYAFTNCTVCGARFSITRDVPYDRERTSMAPFRMCPLCQSEYEDIDNRRYDAQTISCPSCGPELTLHDRDGKRIASGYDAILRLAREIENGAIAVLKSWGGMHIACDVSIVERMRHWYGREQKPFAVMARNTGAIMKLAQPTEEELALAQSPVRPIVLMKKRKNALTEAISPGLPNIGIFLPYTPIHYLLFDALHNIDALIMTSANIPGKPMITRNEDALQLGADYYLLHNREIINRVDDSLVRINDGHTLYIRRSRGIVPVPLEMSCQAGDFIAVGSELNNAGAVSRGGRLYITQYIGDCSDLDTLKFLEEAIRHYIRIFRISSLSGVVMDMHPGYASRYIAREIASEFHVDTIEVQHHAAHAYSLLLDTRSEDAIVLALDGTGYGTDGMIWGGEVIYASGEDWQRLGHLEYFPLPGGDMAVKDPRRTLCSLAQMAGYDLWEDYYAPGDAEVLRKATERGIRTSSMGRFMDALAALLLGVKRRTYEGEPAMKLESILSHEAIVKEAPIMDGRTSVVEIMTWVLENRHLPPQNVASTAVASALKGLFIIAKEKAEEYGLRNIGLSGGVAYNGFVHGYLNALVREHGYTFLSHSRIPPGDGGIAAGQIMFASTAYS